MKGLIVLDPQQQTDTCLMHGPFSTLLHKIVVQPLAGFGSLCVVPQLVFPFLLSEAIMGMAFPLFVLMACEADPNAQYQAGISGMAMCCHCALHQLDLFMENKIRPSCPALRQHVHIF